MSGTTPPSNQPNLPNKIGPYKIEGLLNKGGMSELYLGTHPQTNDHIAIKVLSQKYVSNPEVVQRFLNEAEIIAMTNHPNIVKMYGHGEWEAGLYIAMEYIEGISLRQYLLSTPLSLKRALGIIIDIAYALCHLHTHGVIHRDLKPENILITDTGAIKVIDFGIAQLLSEKDPESQSIKRRLIGTPIYMSPEQKDNPETVSFPSDIYSLGILTYELILGNLSEGRLHLSLMPLGMQQILQKSLLPNPNDRYQDIVDFITDVSSYLNSPLLQKEGIIKDQLSEIQDELFHIQDVLIPDQPTDWEAFEIGIAKRKHLLSPGFYQQFFRLGADDYGLFVGEVSSKGAESFIHTAALKGMISTLAALNLNCGDFREKLYQMLSKQELCPIFNWALLFFHPKQQTFAYTGCGKQYLWLLKGWQLHPLASRKENLAFGTDQEALLKTTSHAWSKDDLLLITSIPNVPMDSQRELIKRFIQDHQPMTPQQFVDVFLRNVRILMKEQVKENPLALIAIMAKSP